MTKFSPAQIDYLNWVKRNLPLVYADHVQPYLSNAGLGSIGTMGDDTTDTSSDSSSVWDDIVSSINSVVPTLTQAYTAYQGTNLATQLATKTAQAQAATTKKNSSMIWLAVAGVGALALILAVK